jgi:hypothetical protein
LNDKVKVLEQKTSELKALETVHKNSEEKLIKLETDLEAKTKDLKETKVIEKRLL